MGLSSRGRRRGVLVLLAARVCRLRRGESNARRGPVGEEEEMRIADILREEEEEAEQCCGDGGRRKRRRRWGKRRKTGGSPSSGSPRCLLSRWLPSRQFFCRACGDGYKNGVLEEEEESEQEEEGREISSVTSLGSTTAMAGASSFAEKEEEGASTSEAMAFSGDGEIARAGSEERKTIDTGLSERKPEQTCLNIGMGAGLLFLLTRSITEFNKMIELRKEMEGMLKEVKEEIQRKNATPSSSESKNNLTFCGSNSWTGTEQSNDLCLHDCNPCLELVEESSFYTEPDNRLEYVKFSEEANSPGIDAIEAELELLQLNLDKQDSSEEPTAEFSVETTDHSERFSLNLGGQHNPQEWAEEQGDGDDDDNTGDQYGVCPHELTRRLHELLETRQQERIAELESALELARIELREKEMEASLWRDAAQLVSQNEEETTLFR